MPVVAGAPAVVTGAAAAGRVRGRQACLHQSQPWPSLLARHMGMSAAKQVANPRLHEQLLVAACWQQQIWLRSDGTEPFQVGSAAENRLGAGNCVALHRGCNHGSRCQLRMWLWRSPALQVVLLLCFDLSNVAGRLCSMMARCACLPAHMPQPCWAETLLPHSQSLAPSAASARSSAGRLPHMLRGSWCIPS